jgi:hypothetical protein
MGFLYGFSYLRTVVFLPVVNLHKPNKNGGEKTKNRINNGSPKTRRARLHSFRRSLRSDHRPRTTLLLCPSRWSRTVSSPSSSGIRYFQLRRGARVEPARRVSHRTQSSSSRRSRRGHAQLFGREKKNVTE